MPEPGLVVTVATLLATAGLKIFGVESTLAEVFREPMGVTGGHLGAEALRELSERVRRWCAGNDRIENQDLKRAVLRSQVLADLFCPLDALPRSSRDYGPWSVLQQRFRKWLRPAPFEGVASQVSIGYLGHTDSALQRYLHKTIVFRVLATEAAVVLPPSEKAV